MEALHTPTIMISSFATLVVFAVFFALASRQERNSLELRLWSCAFLVAALGFTLLALRGPDYSFVAVSLGNALAVLGIAMIWLGLRAFDNQPLKIASALAGPALWLLVTSFSDYVQSNVTTRIVLFSALIFIYSAMIAVEIFRSDNFRKLPSSYIVAFLFATHGLFYLVRIPLIFVWPLFGNTASGAEQPLWYQLLTFELFIHSLAGGFSFFALIKERTQYRYKLASETDALTGVQNRRAFMAKLEAYLATKPVEGALMYMDIDHFKAVNDRYGHAVGDKVLIECATVISQALGGRAFLARMGGEEFSACFRGRPVAGRSDRRRYPRCLRARARQGRKQHAFGNGQHRRRLCRQRAGSERASVVRRPRTLCGKGCREKLRLGHRQGRRCAVCIGASGPTGRTGAFPEKDRQRFDGALRLDASHLHQSVRRHDRRAGFLLAPSGRRVATRYQSAGLGHPAERRGRAMEVGRHPQPATPP